MIFGSLGKHDKVLMLDNFFLVLCLRLKNCRSGQVQMGDVLVAVNGQGLEVENEICIKS